jgi:hypothetical protein
MDFDGVLERKEHFLIFETKDVGKKISKAQQWTLERLARAKSFTIMKVWGKTEPEHFALRTYCPKTGRQTKDIVGVGTQIAKEYVRRWFKWANR